LLEFLEVLVLKYTINIAFKQSNMKGRKRKIRIATASKDRVRRMAFHCFAEISDNRRMRRWPDEALPMPNAV